MQPGNPACLPLLWLHYLFKDHKSVPPKSISRDVVNRFEHVVGLRQDGVLDVWRVGHEAIERGHSSDGRVELVKELVGDTRGDLRAVTPRDAIFVNDERAVGLPD